MSEIQSAVSEIAPTRGSRSGRKPVTLKGGKPLAAARAEAKVKHKEAKAVHRAAIATHREAEKAERVAIKNHAATTKALALVNAKPLPDKAAQKSAVSEAKAAHKASSTALKAAQKQTAAAAKVVTKAFESVTKADNARIAVEQQYAAQKAATLN